MSPTEGDKPFVLCCTCAQPFTLKNQYGRDGMCCSKECFREFDWRRTLDILGKPYRLDPQHTASATADEFHSSPERTAR